MKYLYLILTVTLSMGFVACDSGSKSTPAAPPQNACTFNNTDGRYYDAAGVLNPNCNTQNYNSCIGQNGQYLQNCNYNNQYGPGYNTSYQTNTTSTLRPYDNNSCRSYSNHVVTNYNGQWQCLPWSYYSALAYQNINIQRMYFTGQAYTGYYYPYPSVSYVQNNFYNNNIYYQQQCKNKSWGPFYIQYCK